MVDLGKSPEDILKEEFFRERAVVLGRTGESVQKAIEKLKALELRINELFEHLWTVTEPSDSKGTKYRDLMAVKQQTIEEINEQIRQYNRMREYAKLRYYYLIVTREAMGLRRHNWVEKTYRIPPKKEYLQE